VVATEPPWTRRRWLLPVLCALWAAAAQAEDRGTAAVFVYHSSDQLTVVHPTASMRVQAREKTAVRASYDADVISAATIDVRTAASPRGFEEARHGMALGLEQSLSRLTQADTGIRYSHSPDYVSGSLGLGVTTEDEGRNRSLGLAVNVALDAVGRAGDSERVGHVRSLGTTLSLATILSEWALVDLASSLEYRHGYLQSPYRFIEVQQPGSGEPWTVVPESHPDEHLRAATRARYRVAFTDDFFGRATAGLHIDDWGVIGGTAELEATVELGDAQLSLGGRAGMHDRASFYRGSYQTAPEVPRHRTHDRKLARSLRTAGAARLQYSLGSWGGLLWGTNLNGELLWQRYYDTPRLPRVTALLVGLTLEARR